MCLLIRLQDVESKSTYPRSRVGKRGALLLAACSSSLNTVRYTELQL